MRRISHRRVDNLVERGDTILLKPNYNSSDPFPSLSDPEFIKAIIKLLYEAGAGKVILGERTAFLHSYGVLKQARLIDAAEKAGAETRVFGKDGWQVLFDRSAWRHVKVNGGQYLRRVSVAREVFEIKKIVYAPLIKTHHAAEYTGAVKLSIGFVKLFFDQIMFHMRHLHEKITELGLIIKPGLIIMMRERFSSRVDRREANYVNPT